MSDPRGLVVEAHCKINLTLEVLGKRSDGYHELRSVVQTLTLADEIRVEVCGDETSLTCEGFVTPSGPENLCLRAVAAHQGAFGWSGGVRLHLTKRIPPASGLGGGSSDAAAVLVALRELTGLPEDAKELETVAARLGSDVPLFLRGGTLLMSGRGELLEPLPPIVGPWWAVVARPAVGVSTAEAYAGLASEDFSGGEATGALREALESGTGVAQVAGLVQNCFCRSICERLPSVRGVLDCLLKAGALGVSMSGSGSACFGLFGDAGAARAAVSACAADGYWAGMARGVNAGHLLRTSGE